MCRFSSHFLLAPSDHIAVRFEDLLGDGTLEGDFVDRRLDQGQFSLHRLAHQGGENQEPVDLVGPFKDAVDPGVAAEGRYLIAPLVTPLMIHR